MRYVLILGVMFTTFISSYLFAEGLDKQVVTEVLVGKTSEIQLPDIKVRLDMEKLSSSSSIGTSELLAGLAVLVSLGTLAYQAYQFRIQKKLSIKDTFWMREVLLPRFLDRFLNFVEQAPDYYQSANNLTDFYQSYALHELNKLKDATELLNVGKNGLGTRVLALLDNFDDDVMENINSTSDLSILLNQLAARVITEIRIAQEKIS